MMCGRDCSVELSEENGHQLWVPEGFAHGFCCLVPDCLVAYKVTSPYAPDHDSGIRWSDPDLAIDWPLAPGEAVLSDKDAGLPMFGDLPELFRLS